MTLKIEGLDKLMKQLKQMEKGAKELERTKTIPFDDLFTSYFMHKYTNFSTFDEFLEAGNFVVNSQEDFEAIPETDMDAHVSATAKFSTWKHMLDKATEIYVNKKLGL